MADKRRLKFTRKGWLVHWMRIIAGSALNDDGCRVPRWNDVWVGPFDSAQKAAETVKWYDFRG